MIVIQESWLWILANICLFCIAWFTLYGITVCLRFGDTLTTKSERIAVALTGIPPILFLLIHYGIIVIQ